MLIRRHKPSRSKTFFKIINANKASASITFYASAVHARPALNRQGTTARRDFLGTLLLLGFVDPAPAPRPPPLQKAICRDLTQARTSGVGATGSGLAPQGG